MRGPQHNNNIMLTIANVNQESTTLKQDRSEEAMAPLGLIVAIPVNGVLHLYSYQFMWLITAIGFAIIMICSIVAQNLQSRWARQWEWT